eukprot:12073659-Ditylum_brightwellii.AAC.1
MGQGGSQKIVSEKDEILFIKLCVGDTLLLSLADVRVITVKAEPDDTIGGVRLKWAETVSVVFANCSRVPMIRFLWGRKMQVNCFAEYFLHAATTPSFVMEDGSDSRLLRTSVYERVLATDSASKSMSARVVGFGRDGLSWAGLVAERLALGDKGGSVAAEL